VAGLRPEHTEIGGILPRDHERREAGKQTLADIRRTNRGLSLRATFRPAV